MKSIITHPDGGVTKVSLDLGCFAAFGCIWWGLVIAYVVTAPAIYFGPTWSVVAYIAMGLLAILVIWHLIREGKQ